MAGDPVSLAVSAAIAYGVGYVLNSPRLNVLGPVGGLLGVGPSIDNPLVRPTRGQRLGDLQLTNTVDGSGSIRAFGPENRLGAALVWMTDLKEVKKTEGGGGKAGGGSGGEFIVYQYFAHCLFQFCKAEVPVSRIPRIWADGKLFFNEASSVSLSSALVSSKLEQGIRYTVLGGVEVQVTRNALILESDISAGGVDLSTIKSGGRATVSGFTGGTLLTQLLLTATPANGGTTISLRSTSGSSQALNVDDVIEFDGFEQTYSVQTGVTVLTTTTNVTIRNTVQSGTRPTVVPALGVVARARRGAQINNGTFTVLSASKDPDPAGTQVSTVKLSDQTNGYRLFVVVATGPTIVVTQENPAFKTSQVREVHVMPGGDQQPHQLMVQAEPGISQMYGAKFRACVLFEDLNLTDFGNRIGNFEALVEVTPDPAQVADVIRTVLEEDAGFPSEQVDVSQVSGAVRGFAIQGPQPPASSLLALMLVHDVAHWERGGVNYFANRSALVEKSIDATLLGARDPGEQSPKLLQVSDPPITRLPSEVDVSFRSAESEYQTATKRSPRTEVVPVNVHSIDLGSLVLDEDDGQRIADRLMAIAWGAQRQLSVTLPPSLVGQVREGMVLTFPAYGQTWRMFVEQLDRGANMLLVAQGREFDPDLLVQSATSEGTLGLSATGNTQDGGHTMPAPTDFALLDLPAIQDQERREPGLWIAPTSADPTRPWRGGVLYWSTDEGVTWKRVADVMGEAVIGELVTAPTVTIKPDLWDRANTIRIKIRHTQAQLGSTSEDECLLGRNRFAIGREIIGAARVTFVEYDPVTRTKTYDLSMLLRGQQDTDQEMGGHTAGERVVWLDGPGLTFLPLGFSHVDKTRLWRLVPHGGFLEDAEAVEITPTGRNVKPFHVRDVKISRDGSGNITWTWERTTRAARTFLEQGEPLDEELEQYEIDVVSAGVVVRTIKVTGARTAAYSAANQVTDVSGLLNPCTARFYQFSQSFFRGRLTEVTL